MFFKIKCAKEFYMRSDFNPYLFNDVVSFCEIRNDPKAFSAYIQAEGAQGISNGEALKALAEKGDYIPVLKAIWSEKDHTRQLTWLRSNASLHAPLMFELALAEFAAAPTVETIELISFPLISAANLRINQDSVCSQDYFIYSLPPSDMGKAYCKSLDQLMQKHLFHPFDRFNLSQRCLQASIQKSIETLLSSKSLPLPNPTWISWHTDATASDALKMHPAGDWKKLREDFANKKLADG
jgi:hypothetical protein